MDLQVQRRRRQGVWRWVPRFDCEDQRGRTARPVRQRRRLPHWEWSRGRRGQQSGVRIAVGQRFDFGGGDSVHSDGPRKHAARHTLAAPIRPTGAAVRTTGSCATVRPSAPIRTTGPIRPTELVRGAVPVRPAGRVHVTGRCRGTVPERRAANAGSYATGPRIATVQHAAAHVVVDRPLTVRSVRRARAVETLRGQTQRYLEQIKIIPFIIISYNMITVLNTIYIFRVVIIILKYLLIITYAFASCLCSVYNILYLVYMEEIKQYYSKRSIALTA